MKDEPAASTGVGWGAAPAVLLGLGVGFVAAEVALAITFFSLGWVPAEPDPLKQLLGVVLSVFPLASLMSCMAAIVAVMFRRTGIACLLPALTIPVFSAAAVGLCHGWVEAAQAALSLAADQALDENGFFITAWLWDYVTWQTFFMAAFLVFTVAIDLVLLPFVVFFDPDVLLALADVLFRVLILSLGGSAVSAALWGPVLAARMKAIGVRQRAEGHAHRGQ